MTRKAVAKSLKSLSRLRSAIRCSRDRLSPQLSERPAAQHVEALDYKPLFEHLQTELAIVEGRLTTAESAYANEKRQLANARQDRERAVPALYRLQCDVKRLLQAVLGSRQLLELAGIDGKTPQSSQSLICQVKSTVLFLRTLDDVPPPPPLAITFDTLAFADKLQSERERVEALCRAVEVANFGAVAAQCDADEAAAEADRVMPCVVSVVEGVGRLAENDRLARRVRGQ